MFKQIFRLTFVTIIWKQYKRGIISIVCLLVSLWLINFAHREYLAFTEHLSQTSYIGLSFYIKWALLIVVVLIYLCVSLYSPKDKQKSEIKQNRTTETKAANSDDPFAFIREKEALRTKAEIVLEKHSSDQTKK